MKVRERCPERVSLQGVAKGKLPAVPEQGLKCSPPSGGSFTHFASFEMGRGPKREVAEFDLRWPIRALSPAPRLHRKQPAPRGIRYGDYMPRN
jgi:hypothetical protein